MEKRKLLLVAVSVGVFLVIVLSAAILIFTPGGGASALAARTALPAPAVSSPPAGGPASADVVDMIRSPGEIQGLMVPPDAPALSAAPENPASSTASGRGAAVVQENNVYVNGGTSPAADTTSVVINVPRPAAPAIPVARDRVTSPAAPSAGASRQTTPAVTAAPVTGAPVASAVTTPVAAPSSSSTTASPASAAAPRNTGTSTGSSSTAPARTSAAPAAARTASGAETASRSIRDYWIQTGAFSALVRAENAKESLAAKGLNSIIDNREVDGRIWYRVRIGPYTSESEAGYWLALVRAIDGFGDSQVRSTQR
jgi:DedD protein